MLMVLVALTAVRCGLYGLDEKPVIESVEPALVCLDSLPARVTIRGSGFRPVVHDMIGESSIVLPRITLTRYRSDDVRVVPFREYEIQGSEVGEEIGVHWHSDELMQFDLTTSLGLEPGLYALEVENPQGDADMMYGALLAVRKPRITTVYPDYGCTSPRENWSLFVSGGPFIMRDGLLPIMFFEAGAWAYWATEAIDCLAFDDTTMSSCSKLRFGFVRRYLSDEEGGTPRVFVSSLPGGGCYGSSETTVELVGCPKLTSVSPDIACLAQEERLVTLSGRGLVFEGGVTPRVWTGYRHIEDTTLLDCEPAPGGTTCSSVEFHLPVRGAMEDEMINLSLLDLVRDDCCYLDPVALYVVPPPRVESSSGSLDPFRPPETVSFVGRYITYESLLPVVSFNDEPPQPALGVEDCEPLEGTEGVARSCTMLEALLPEHLVEPGAILEVRVTNPDPVGCTSGIGLLVFRGEPP
jgi:hypothetical protein